MRKIAGWTIGLAALTNGQNDAPNMSNEKLFTEWKAFTTSIVYPEVIHMRNGGTLEMNIAETIHAWGAGAPNTTTYGYGQAGGSITTPGPTILVKKGVPITVQWNNAIKSNKHLLDTNVEQSLTTSESACYPDCGIPVVTHIHGLEGPARFDGLPHYSIYRNQSFTARYNNNQSASLKMYHDHAMGLAHEVLEKKYNLDNLTDIPLIIQDKIIYPDGTLVYSSVATCQTPGTKWVAESFGSVNTINGVVMPYVEVPAAQVRFRFVNMANARHYNLTLPFADQCKLIASDSGYVGRPSSIDSQGFLIFPLERMELVCDLSGIAVGETFDLSDTTDIDSSYSYDPRLLQFRIVAPLTDVSKAEIPSKMTALKDLQELYKSTNGKLRTITLSEMEDDNQCPTQLLIVQRQMIANMSMIQNKLMCTLGKIEKWQFKNPTDDAHPFHWHLVNAQCGPDDNSINKNELKDVVVIPNEPKSQKITQVCYVACTPDQFLIEGSLVGPTDYEFDTDQPYLAHCHIMEHEENSMMAWFQINKVDDDAPVDDGSVADANSKATSEVIWCAIGMSVIGGFATCLSVLVLSIKRLNFLTGDKALAITFALSTGVMLFIALSDLFLESIEKFNAALAVGGTVDLELVEEGLAPSGATAPICNNTCHGKAYLAVVGCFVGGVMIVVLLELLIHKVFDFHSKKLGEQLATRQAIQAPPVPVEENGDLIVKTPTNQPDSYDRLTDEEEALTEKSDENHRTELGRAGVLTGVAIAIHNFPEGIALFVASLQGLRSGIVLAVGIILHNFPEGVAIAAPVYYATKSYKQALFWTSLSGIAQPLGALVGWATISGGVNNTTTGILYAMVSGMLCCIAVKELIPGAFKYGPKVFTASFFIGFLIMAGSVVILKYVGSS